MEVIVLLLTLFLLQVETVSSLMRQTRVSSEHSTYTTVGRLHSYNETDIVEALPTPNVYSISHDGLRNLTRKSTNHPASEHITKTWLIRGTRKVESSRNKDERRRRKVSHEGNLWKRQLRRDEQRRPPYSSTVRLSIGCTGTLLSTRHVLTAAHCIHNGSQLTINVRNFRVQIPPHGGGRPVEFPASEIRLPRKWANDETYARFRAMYDFAVITLSEETPSNWVRPTVTIADVEPLEDLQDDFVQFAGFPTGSSATRKVCSFRGARYIHEESVLYLKRCAASPGYSGAGIFRVARRNRSQLVGVVSHLIQQNTNGQKVKYIVISSFTERKKQLLCHMMNTVSDSREVCGPIEDQSRSSNHLPYVGFDISSRL